MFLNYFSSFLAWIFVFFLTGFKPVNNLANNTQEYNPNVLLIITDDQGYGDLSCHGNPWIKTPNMDQLYKESIRLTDFHVSPTCAPTRAALLTGHVSDHTGVWHTIGGRSLLRQNELTMADIFSDNGYQTGIFGKWHLGDNYPFRPQDRGFKEVLIHGGGGVGQTPDYWDNDYFNDTYIHNGKNEKFKGYCTDIWFNNALKFISRNKNKRFFCYLSTNAPHGPFNVEDKYRKQYMKNKDIVNSEFYGMITNIDQNLGILMQKLKEWGLLKNTIIIFMTDNGTAAGVKIEKGSDGFPVAGFGAGMRGKKSSMYEGGHRVPCFIKGPGIKLNPGTDIDELTAHIDLLPTLIDLCNLEYPKNYKFDGISLFGILSGKTKKLAERSVITDSQRIEYPEKWRRSSVMFHKWRLINGKELYNLTTDPDQSDDISGDHPELVQKLRSDYEKWWADISPTFPQTPRIILGQPGINNVRLTCHDWHSKGKVPWHQGFIREGLIGNGKWAIKVVSGGNYEFYLRRWPSETNTGIMAAYPVKEAISGTSVKRTKPGKALSIEKARIKIGEIEKEKTVKMDDLYVKFTLPLTEGDFDLQTWFTNETGLELGAYYVYIKKI